MNIHIVKRRIKTARFSVPIKEIKTGIQHNVISNVDKTMNIYELLLIMYII